MNLLSRLADVVWRAQEGTTASTAEQQQEAGQHRGLHNYYDRMRRASTTHKKLKKAKEYELTEF